MSSLKQLTRRPPRGRDASSTELPVDNAQWRSTGNFEDTPEFRAFVAREFPEQAGDMLDPLSRRRFVQLMGASLAFAGVAGATGCRGEEERIVPLSRRPDGYVPGVAKSYATAWELAGAGEGLLVTAYDGRPIKIEGNPQHPFTGKSTTAFAQASVLGLYDPDRSRRVSRRENGQDVAATWADFVAYARDLRSKLLPSSGAGLRVLSASTSSPTVDALRRELLAGLPQARWHEYEPLSRDNEREGTRLAFGTPQRTHLRLDRARVIATFDAEIVAEHPASLRYARDFVSGRVPESGSMNTLYSVESAFTLTGGMADHRLPVRAELIKPILLGLEQILLGGDPASVGAAILSEAQVSSFIAALAKDLAANRGRGVVAVGARQPAEVHAIAARINERLSNANATVLYTADPNPERPHHHDDLAALVADIRQGKVSALLILGGNPAYDAPADLDVAGALAKVPSSMHLSLYDDETSALCNWRLNQAHFLESWGDTRSWDGTYAVIQPLIEPLHDGVSAIDVLKVLAGTEDASSEELVKRTFKVLTNKVFEGDKSWRKVLHDGFAPETAFPATRTALTAFEVAPLTASQKLGTRIGNGNLEVAFVPSMQTYDGRFANNGWLQETPDFLTKLTWDNAALISPRTASDLGIAHQDVVEIKVGDRTLEVAAYVMPGQAPYSIALPLGYGRTRAGNVGGHDENGVASRGFDTYRLRTTQSMGFGTGATVKATGKRYDLATTQDHYDLDATAQAEVQSRAKDQVKTETFESYKKHPDFVLASAHIEADKKLTRPETAEDFNASLFDEAEYKGRRWGMTTDLSKCTGCNACMLACQSENNVPIVGKEQVIANREMHWIRIDRYFVGNVENPTVAHQPVFCQQCENAPCEQVCPVGATSHSAEGLNDMAYNRCVGTRYCANNCPYKVRKFNFFYWHKELDEARNKVKTLAFNPEVTVRSRGVMEKCTWCVQRIERVKIEAKNERRQIRDGDIKTACQQACPTDAITFGDLADENSAVSKLHGLPRAYALLASLNTKPRHAFLARIRNPNEDLEPAKQGQDHE